MPFQETEVPRYDECGKKVRINEAQVAREALGDLPGEQVPDLGAEWGELPPLSHAVDQEAKTNTPALLTASHLLCSFAECAGGGRQGVGRDGSFGEFGERVFKSTKSRKA